MNKIYLLIFSVLFSVSLYSQTQTYTVEKTSFSTDKYDEFAPVWYKNGIVFSSNRGTNPLLSYLDSLNMRTIKLHYIDTIPDLKWKKTEDFATEIRTKLNDGPASIISSGDTIYYSRNLIAEGKKIELSASRNKLGIFSAVNNNEGEWEKVKELRFNSEWYNNTLPCISPNNDTLFFVSDMPGGYGGTDLYYSTNINGYWQDPINLGPRINTTGNESYPYMNSARELFFSSDGHEGLGGKDIFVTKHRLMAGLYLLLLTNR